jgi:nucleoside-diphosphate-sugar epimerase
MSYLNGALKDKNILVTGATGFIGRRLSQRLAEEEGAVVTGTGRNLARASFLKAFGVNLQQADLLDHAAIDQLMHGQAVVFHLGWLGRDKGAVGGGHALNVAATQDVITLAAAAGAERVIFASSINAYGPPKQNQTDEATPANVNQRDAYGRAKALSEIKARELASVSALELVIARPGMVYGPHSPNWTINMLQLVQKGVPVIFGSGSGFAYPAYIDNVVDGLLLSAVHPQAAGEAFNFCDPPVDWNTFFGYYAAMCGRKPRAIPLSAARLLAWASETFSLGLPLTRERLEYYVNQNEFPTTKAAALLGYRPRIDIETGMQLTEAWLRQQGYLDR